MFFEEKNSSLFVEFRIIFIVGYYFIILMIAGILRGVLLRFASEYLSNVDISKLSL